MTAENDEHCWDLAIVGGGAAGLALAAFLGRQLQEAHTAGHPSRSARPRIALVDSAAKLGAKILVSGGGRCNVTHRQIDRSDFCGNPHLVGRILARFDHEAAREWFEQMGVRLKVEDTGKLFPVTDRARTVLDAILTEVRQGGTNLLLQHRVSAIHQAAGVDQACTPDRRRFALTVEGRETPLWAKQVALCTGGRSLPRTGSDGWGYRLAQMLGHSVTSTVPALVPLLLEPSFFHHRISGTSCHARLTIRAASAKRPLFDRCGDLLFTHFGISGPLAMDASRYWTTAEGRQLEVRLGLLADMTEAEAERLLMEHPGLPGSATVATLLQSKLSRRLVEVLLEHVGVPGSTRLAELPRVARNQLALSLTGMILPVAGPRGWNYAEVTAGGVPLGEINPQTMESRCCPGLYLAGEILDCDGRIGGFNFQWAWATAYVAASHLVGLLTLDEISDAAAEA